MRRKHYSPTRSAPFFFSSEKILSRLFENFQKSRSPSLCGVAVDAAVARRVLYDLALGAKSEQVRLYAAKDMLSRASVRPAESGVHYSDVDQLSEVELRDKILTLFDDLKIVDG